MPSRTQLITPSLRTRGKHGGDPEIVLETQHEPTTLLSEYQIRRLRSVISSTGLREFPWRHSGVPVFHILLAEILLKQTKADDAASVWRLLINRYPTPLAVGTARQSTLARVIKQLGLQNQRAQALKELARALNSDFGGKVPRTLEELLQLPHVGLYTACAVLCFGWGKSYPIVDSNVLRLFKRYLGHDCGRDVRRNADAWKIAWTILDRRSAKRFNYALLDFTATICAPRKPNCAQCALKRSCAFYVATGSGPPD